MTVAWPPTLAAGLRAHETSDALIEDRLALAGRVAEEMRGAEPVDAALVVGSTALRRCSARADLDLVLVTPSAGRKDRFQWRAVDGVRVEVERIGRRRALAGTAGRGWVWELRAAARLGCGVPVFDPDGFALRLAQAAAAMTPWPDRYEAVLRDVYLLLIDLGRGEGDLARRADALRGCMDNLALLALLERPRRYQKAKWALADLVHAGEDALAEAMLAAYGIGSDDADAADHAVYGARGLVERAYALLGLPPHDTILGMGYAPELAQASYVSRCLDDADDLAVSGRAVEAQYVARFAARLVAGLLSAPGSDDCVLDVLAACEGGMATEYLALFPDAADPSAGLLEAALDAADGRRRALEGMPSA